MKRKKPGLAEVAQPIGACPEEFLEGAQKSNTEAARAEPRVPPFHPAMSRAVIRCSTELSAVSG